MENMVDSTHRPATSETTPEELVVRRGVDHPEIGEFGGTSESLQLSAAAVSSPQGTSLMNDETPSEVNAIQDDDMIGNPEIQVVSSSDSEDDTPKCPSGLINAPEGERARRVHQKSNFVAVLESMRVMKAPFYVPLCRMVALPRVRPLQDVDVCALQKQFEGGYIDGDRSFYISVFDDSEKTPDYAGFSGKMFFVWDGNHRLNAWRRFITEVHPNEETWHYSVSSVVLNPKGRISVLLNCMHDVNWSTQNNHVKVSLPAKLQQIRYYGGLKLKDFKDLLTSTEFKICAKVRHSRSAWFPLTIDVFISFLYRQDLARAADEAAIEFERTTPAEERTAEGVWKVMNAAEASMVKSIKNKDFQKYLSVANPKHGEGFFEEINYHFSHFKTTEMTIERLQKVATSAVEPEFKARWLHQWNSPPFVRSAYRFPSPRFKDSALDVFLNRASFWAQLEEKFIGEFEKLCNSGAITIDWNASPGIMRPTDYVEKWRMILWEKAFMFFVHPTVKPPFLKGSNLYGIPKADLLIQRLLYRYIVRELLPKNALGVFSCPVFLSPWIQSSSDICIFTDIQKEKFSVPLLQGSGWYLECSSRFVPDEKMELYNSLSGLTSMPVSSHPMGEDMVEEQSSLRPTDVQEKTTKKKKRLSKAEKAKLVVEEAEKVEAAKKAEIEEAVAAALATRAQVNVSVVPNPADVTRDDDIVWNSSPIMASSQAGGSSLIEVTRMEVHQRKKRQFQQSESSIAAVQSVPSESLIQNCSLFLLMQSLTQPNALPQPWTSLHEFISKVGADRRRQVSSERCKHSGLDLIIADIPENLPVPGISNPTSAIPLWNVRPEKYIDTVFEFADNFIHDNAALLLFHANDRELQLEIEDCASTYDFKLLMDWWALNELPLALPRDPSATGTRFCVQLFVRDSIDGFRFRVRAPLKELDILFNPVNASIQHLHGDSPWRGPREKSDDLMKSVIESLTSVGDIVLDWNASTGPAIRACQSLGRHIAAFEEDSEIFQSLLAPLIPKLPAVPTGQKRKGVRRMQGQEPQKKQKSNRIPSCEVHQDFPIPSMLRPLPQSPPPHFILPVYVEQAAAFMSTVMLPRPQREVRNYDNGVFKYLDLQAQEGIGSEDSSDDME